MRSFTCLAWGSTALLLFVAPVLAGGVLEGVVAIGKGSPAPPPGARYAIKTSGAVADAETPAAIVYLEGVLPVSSNAPPTVQIAQKGFQFRPGVLPVRKGTKVEFPNEDDDYHNVFSYSKAKRFDLGRYKKEEKPAAVVFDTPGLVKLYCEIHEHMRGAILVLDTPHFLKTGPDGKFRLENVPAGKFKLKAWLNEKSTLEKEVEIKEGQTLQVNFP